MGVMTEERGASLTAHKFVFVFECACACVCGLYISRCKSACECVSVFKGSHAGKIYKMGAALLQGSLLYKHDTI